MLVNTVLPILGELVTILKTKKLVKNYQTNLDTMIPLPQLNLLMKSHSKKLLTFLKTQLVSVLIKICQSMLPDLSVTSFMLLKEEWKIGDMPLVGKTMPKKNMKVKKLNKMNNQSLKNVNLKFMEEKNSNLTLELIKTTLELV
jgi:hypothetical protein